MRISLKKLKAMILYFATYTDPKLLGKKKLMKLFYFSDFSHVKKYATPITYDSYVNLEHGPIPSKIMNLVSAVENDIDNSLLGDTLSIETKEGSHMKRIITRREFTEKDSNYFTPTELRVMEDVCKRFAVSTGKDIEDASHKEAAWSSTRELDDIPYTFAVADPDCIVEKEDIEALLAIS